MSMKFESVFGVFRECQNFNSSSHDKLGKEFDPENFLQATFPNDLELHHRVLSDEKTNICRVLNFTSSNAELIRPVSKSKKIGKKILVPFKDQPDTLSVHPEKFIFGSLWRTESMFFTALYKMLAIACLKNDNELNAVKLLTESHAVILQQFVKHRYSKVEIRNRYTALQLQPGISPRHMTDKLQSIINSDSLRNKLAEMPKEWYMVQLTVPYDELNYQKVSGTIIESMCPLHITILPTGPSAIDPFCITLPIPKNEHYDGIKELVRILKRNKADLEAFYSSNAFYWKMRDNQNSKMKAAVMELEHSWLREWRILLMADPLEDTSMIKEMRQMVDKLLADNLSIVQVSDRTRWLLRKIATSSCYLSKMEIARAVFHVLHDNPKLARNVILSIHGKLTNVNELRTEKRKSLIMILDESIDHIPFESMDIMNTHPATRFPSFNIAYAMFKEHKDTIVNGCKVLKVHGKFGSCVINPEKNLNKMERRMKLFMDYWLPGWEAKYGVKPTETCFEKILLNRDVLMYSGHGSGIQYLPGEKIEKLRVRSNVLLFGCSSVKLYPVGGVFPPSGVSNQYLIACSPCILGMLWEVTDGDIDRMTTSFMSDWIPSKAERPWSDINLTKWCDGIFKFNESRPTLREIMNEPEMLRAVAKAKKICMQHMTAAAIIVRGLPLRLET